MNWASVSRAAIRSTSRWRRSPSTTDTPASIIMPFRSCTRKGIPAGIFVVTETLGRHYLHVYDKLFLLLARVLPMIDHNAERLTTLCESHDVPLARQHRLKDVIKDPFDTMRLLFTTLTQKQLRRAIEALETVVQIRDEDFPALHSLTWDMVRALDRA